MKRLIFVMVIMISCLAQAQDNWGPATMVYSDNWEEYAGLYGLASPAISDNDSLLFFVQLGAMPGSDIIYSYFADSDWQVPLTGPFYGYGQEPFFLEADDTLLLFSSGAEGGYGGFDIWAARFSGGEWSEPWNLGPNVNTSAYELFPSMPDDARRIYFMRGNIMYCDSLGDGFGEAVMLPALINSNQYESFPVISPDGSRLYFNRSYDPFGYNPNLIYVSSRTGDQWLEPQLLNGNINFYFSNDPYYGYSYKPTFCLGGAKMYFGHGEANIIGEPEMTIFCSELGVLIDDENQNIPADFSITAYPNPFNAQTKIRLAGELPQVNQIAIYDLGGRLVTTLAPAPEITWAGTNQAGDQVPSGIYFVKAAGQRKSAVVKVTLLR